VRKALLDMAFKRTSWRKMAESPLCIKNHRYTDIKQGFEKYCLLKIILIRD